MRRGRAPRLCLPRFRPGVIRLRAILTSSAILLTAFAGCQKKERFAPIPTFPVVTWADLTGGQPVNVDNNYQLVVSDTTRGLFPTSVAVARFAASEETAGEGARLKLDMTPEVDFLAWNSVFDDFRSISEVFPMNAMALDGAAVSVRSLLHAAVALQAGMLLVYAENHSSEQDSEIRGVLYEAPSGRVLAVIHARGHVETPIAFDEQADRKVPLEDHLKRDTRLLTIRTFESTMRACLLALMANDEPAERVAPEGWIPDRQFEPLTWPPGENLGRRRP